MEITINSKELRDAIHAVLLKGKWNLGQSMKNHQLNSVVILEVDALGNTFLYNGDEATYIQYRLDVGDDVKVGTVYLNTDTLVKYLKGNVELKLSDNNGKGALEIITDTSIITLNTLESHPHNDSINQIKDRASKGEWDDWQIPIQAQHGEGISISDTSKLNTVLGLTGSYLKDAFKACELVGSGIFKLDYIGDNRLCVASSHTMESMHHDIEVDYAHGPNASVEFSAPLHLLLNESTVIAFNNDSPVFILNDRVKMLRAPRFEGDA
tara:strand:- start:495 stop:1295 length:801 start_codon:yes stop_codon:yes gene_type:complete